MPLVPALKAQGADAIVLLIHQGGKTAAVHYRQGLRPPRRRHPADPGEARSGDRRRSCRAIPIGPTSASSGAGGTTAPAADQRRQERILLHRHPAGIRPCQPAVDRPAGRRTNVVGNGRAPVAEQPAGQGAGRPLCGRRRAGRQPGDRQAERGRDPRRGRLGERRPATSSPMSSWPPLRRRTWAGPRSPWSTAAACGPTRPGGRRQRHLRPIVRDAAVREQPRRHDADRRAAEGAAGAAIRQRRQHGRRAPTSLLPSQGFAFAYDLVAGRRDSGSSRWRSTASRSIRRARYRVDGQQFHGIGRRQFHRLHGGHRHHSTPASSTSTRW